MFKGKLTRIKSLHKNSCQLDCKLKPEPLHTALYSCVQYCVQLYSHYILIPGPAPAESVSEPEPGWASDQSQTWVSVQDRRRTPRYIWPIIHYTVSNRTSETWWEQFVERFVTQKSCFDAECVKYFSTRDLVYWWRTFIGCQVKSYQVNWR